MNNLLKISFILLIISCSSQHQCIDVKVILPENYQKNYIVIFYNQRNGNPKEVDERGNKIFKIPNTGILYTQDVPQINCMYKRNTYISKGKLLMHIPDHALAEYKGDKIISDSLYTFSGFFRDEKNFGYDCDYYFLGTTDEIKERNGIMKPLAITNKMIDSIAQNNGWKR